MSTHHVDRRAFLISTGALAALPWTSSVALGGTQSNNGPRPERLRIGIASYSLRKFPLPKALAMARAANVRYMTFKDVHIPRTDPPETIRANRALIEAAGITIMGGGTIEMKNDQAQIRRDFEYAKHAGFPMIYAKPDPAALDFIEQLVKEFDLRFLIHNHGPEDQWYPAPQDAYRHLRTRDKRMGLCVDIGHTIRTGTDPVEAILTHSDRVYDLHVKDLKDPKDKDSQVEVGRGVLDIPALVRALLKIRYVGQVGLEYEIHENDPLVGIIESLAYLRGVLAATTT